MIARIAMVLTVFAGAWLLGGCLGRAAAINGFPDSGPGAPTTPIETVSNWSLWAGAACIPLAAIIGIIGSKPRLAVSIAIGGVCLIVSGWVVGYIESHKGWFLMGFAALGIYWYAKAHPSIVDTLQRRLRVNIPGLGTDDTYLPPARPRQTPEDKAQAIAQADIPTEKIERAKPAWPDPSIVSAAQNQSD